MASSIKRVILLSVLIALVGTTSYSTYHAYMWHKTSTILAFILVEAGEQLIMCEELAALNGTDIAL